MALYGTEGLSRADWLAGRAEYVGASEVAKVLGLHPRGGPLSVYLAKVGEEEDVADNAAIRRGVSREPLILADASDALAEEFGAAVPVVPHPYVIRHPDHEMLACNLDGLAKLPSGDVAVVEAKWMGSWARGLWRAYAEDKVPPAGTYLECHYVQVQAQLAVSGLAHGYLAGDCDASFYLMRVERDEALIAIIGEQIAAFWDRHVRAGTPPPADARDGDAIRRAYRKSAEGKTVDLSGLADEVAELRDLRAQRKEIEAREKEIKAIVLAEMTDAQFGDLPDGSRVRMVDVTKRSFDARAFKAHHPELHEEFTRRVSFRQFRP